MLQIFQIRYYTALHTKKVKIYKPSKFAQKIEPGPHVGIKALAESDWEILIIIDH